MSTRPYLLQTLGCAPRWRPRFSRTRSTLTTCTRRSTAPAYRDDEEAGASVEAELVGMLRAELESKGLEIENLTRENGELKTKLE